VSRASRISKLTLSIPRDSIVAILDAHSPRRQREEEPLDARLLCACARACNQAGAHCARATCVRCKWDFFHRIDRAGARLDASREFAPCNDRVNDRVPCTNLLSLILFVALLAIVATPPRGRRGVGKGEISALSHSLGAKREGRASECGAHWEICFEK